MKPCKLCVLVLGVVIVSALLFVADLLSLPMQSSGMANTDLAASLPFLANASALQAGEEMRPAFWWTVFAILLIDIGCVIGYLRYQRQMQWRRIHWRLAAVERQHLSAMLAALHTPETITVQRYELCEQAKAGGFYLALKSKKAPAPYGPALFS